MTSALDLAESGFKVLPCDGATVRNTIASAWKNER
jgi:hypothetical protein